MRAKETHWLVTVMDWVGVGLIEESEAEVSS
jgi:hypothetical protein